MLAVAATAMVCGACARRAAKDPKGPEKGLNKVVKGGDSGHCEDFSRISFRYLCPPSARDWTKIGFRCVSEGL